MNINMNTCIQVKYGTMKIGFKPQKRQKMRWDWELDQKKEEKNVFKPHLN